MKYLSIAISNKGYAVFISSLNMYSSYLIYVKNAMYKLFILHVKSHLTDISYS